MVLSGGVIARQPPSEMLLHLPRLIMPRKSPRPKTLSLGAKPLIVHRAVIVPIRSSARIPPSARRFSQTKLRGRPKVPTMRALHIPHRADLHPVVLDKHRLDKHRMVPAQPASDGASQPEAATSDGPGPVRNNPEWKAVDSGNGYNPVTTPNTPLVSFNLFLICFISAINCSFG